MAFTERLSPIRYLIFTLQVYERVEKSLVKYMKEWGNLSFQSEKVPNG